MAANPLVTPRPPRRLPATGWRRYDLLDPASVGGLLRCRRCKALLLDSEADRRGHDAHHDILDDLVRAREETST